MSMLLCLQIIAVTAVILGLAFALTLMLLEFYFEMSRETAIEIHREIFSNFDAEMQRVPGLNDLTQEL